MREMHGRTRLYRDRAGVLVVERSAPKRVGGYYQCRVGSDPMKALRSVGAPPREREMVLRTLDASR